LHPECDSKELRNIAMLNHYQRHCVVHEERFREFENQLFAYPKVMWDDDIDAVSAGVEYFLKPKVKRPTPSIRMTSYV
jgi:phage terminase large subunit-like protein